MSRFLMRGGALWRALVLVVLLGGAVVLALGWRQFTHFSDAPLSVTASGESLEVARGSAFKQIVAQLRQRGLSNGSPIFWRILAEQMRVADKLHAGEYALPAGITPRVLLSNMAAGHVLQHNFTIVDGWTFAELRTALDSAKALEHLTAGLDNAALMQRLGAPGEMPEGRFLPETYAFVKGDSDIDVLKRAHADMRKTLDAAWAARDKSLPLATPYEALILASIVERETGRADERRRIAGVFVRRLENHMLLQTDPSVIYGMGASYAGNIRRSDLTTDTPYNTYTRPGLPPTPIALPGKPAIEAALHPASGEDLYFVARGDGSHVFASTLAEHNRNVACFQLKRCP